MALWRATIYKHSTVFGEAWSNVYTLNVIDAFNAQEQAGVIAERERAVSYSTVVFDKTHVINLADHRQTRTNGLFGAVGVLDPTGLGGPLPLFCTVRVLFTNVTGKPEQKYLRLGANEANLTLGRWDGDFTSFIVDGYATPLLANTEYVGPSGEAHLAYDVLDTVQNRQLGWHRRHRPGFKRGWVPA